MPYRSTGQPCKSTREPCQKLSPCVSIAAPASATIRIFTETALALGREMAERRRQAGLWGRKCRVDGHHRPSVLDHGGYVTGIIPDF